MRKILNLTIFIPLLLSVFLYLYFALTIYAYKPSNNCPDLPLVSAKIEPRSGNQNTQFKVTINWDQLGSSDFSKYNDVDLYIATYIPKSDPNRTDSIATIKDTAAGRSSGKRTHTLTGFTIQKGTYDAEILLASDQSLLCKDYGSLPVIFTFENTGGKSTLKEGDACNPDLQSNQEFKCPTSTQCQGNDSAGYFCKKSGNAPPKVDSKTSGSKSGGANSFTLNDIFKSDIVPNFKFSNAKIGDVISEFLNIVFYIAAFMAFFWLVWASFQYILAKGEKEALGKARARITWAAAGLIVIFLAYLVARYASEIFPPGVGGVPF